MTRTISADVAIIGGGIIGLSTGLELQERGIKAVVLEKGMMGAEASGRNGGGVRAQGRHVEEIPLALAAFEMWKEMSSRVGADVGYRQTGHVFIAEQADNIQKLEKMQAEERAAGLETRMLTEAELLEFVPGLKPGYFGGKHSTVCGSADASAATAAIGLAFERAGGTLITGQQVIDITIQNRAVSAVETRETKVFAPIVVNCAGPWAPNVASLAGIYLPIYPRRSNICYTEPLPLQTKCFTQSVMQNMAIRQLPSGHVFLASGAPQPNGNPLFTWSKDYFDLSMDETPRPVKSDIMFPAIAKAKIMGRWCGTTENTPDKMPIIDRIFTDVGGVDGFYAAAGFSGHGFCLGPIVGKMLAEWVRDGKPSMDLSDFTYMRFMRADSPWAKPRHQTQDIG